MSTVTHTLPGLLLAALLSSALGLGCAPWYRDDELRALRAHDHARLSMLVAEGEQHLRAGRAEQAEQRFAEAAELNPHHGPALAGLARALALQGRDEAARAVARFAVKKAPDGAAEARAYLLASYADQGLYALALDQLRSSDLAAAVGDRRLVAAYGPLAEARELAREGHAEEALERYAEWLADYGVPDHHALRRAADEILEHAAPLATELRKRAADYAARGRMIEATLAYALAYRYTPSTDIDTLARQKLAAASSRVPDRTALSLIAAEQAASGDEALRQGRLGEGLRGYRRAVVAAPYWPELRHNLALAFAGVGMYREAALHMQWFLQLAPGSGRAAQAEALLRSWKARAEEGAR